MFSRLEQETGDIKGKAKVNAILSDPIFADFSDINVLPLIYDEKRQRCNILVFDYGRARGAVAEIQKQTAGNGRIHPVYRFLDASGDYICEVRYGGASANALQRGLWTHTKNALKFFDSVTSGWIDYSHNLVLVQLFSHALVSSSVGHANALEKVKEDIAIFKQSEGLPQ